MGEEIQRIGPRQSQSVSGFFFFQAEDGIRDVAVTGVQTCALPILAPEIFRALFNAASPAGNLEKLRAAVLDKNEQWHARYRTVDGYNVYGGRSKLEFPSAGKESPMISNRQVMQEEMTQRDVMTANRDKRISAVAKGGDPKVADNNLRPAERF